MKENRFGRFKRGYSCIACYASYQNTNQDSEKFRNDFLTPAAAQTVPAADPSAAAVPESRLLLLESRLTDLESRLPALEKRVAQLEEGRTV